MGPSLFIRTDAGPQLGTGHFMRMLAVAEAWSELGGNVSFGGTIPSKLAQRATSMGATVVAPHEDMADVAWTVAAAQQAQASVVVADGYHFPVEFQTEMRRAGLALMVVDDNGENRRYDARWILNVNLHADEVMYQDKSADCECLLGTRYALIRKAIREGSGITEKPASRRLLITMGGADPADVTGKLLLELERRGSAACDSTVLVGAANPRWSTYQARVLPRTQLLFDVADVTPVMRSSSVALVAAGGTIWELALLGVPSVTVSVADNQVQLARELHRRGAALSAGDVRGDGHASTWLDMAESLLDDEAQRTSLVSHARELVDGLGAVRVVQHLWKATS